MRPLLEDVFDDRQRTLSRPRRAGARGWHAIATVRALAPVVVDAAALRFWPFRAGRGVRPRGFVHALRKAAYRASFSARRIAIGTAPSVARLL